MRSILIAGVFALLAVAAHAQGGRTPPPERERLGFLVGEFAGQVTLYGADAAPAGTATMKFRGEWDLDGTWVVARYEQPYGQHVVRGLLLYTWETTGRRYLYYGVPNHPMEPARMIGAMEGARLTFETGPDAANGFRETWEGVGADTLVTTLSFRREGKWVLGTRAVLARQPPDPARR